jgi:hypothetical protein
VRELPDYEQEVAAKFLLAFASPEAHRYQLTDDQLAEVEFAKREVREGKVAADAQMADVWQRFAQ